MNKHWNSPLTRLWVGGGGGGGEGGYYNMGNMDLPIGGKDWRHAPAFQIVLFTLSLILHDWQTCYGTLASTITSHSLRILKYIICECIICECIICEVIELV